MIAYRPTKKGNVNMGRGKVTASSAEDPKFVLMGNKRVIAEIALIAPMENFNENVRIVRVFNSVAMLNVS
jgi:hypothetical protein